MKKNQDAFRALATSPILLPTSPTPKPPSALDEQHLARLKKLLDVNGPLCQVLSQVRVSIIKVQSPKDMVFAAIDEYGELLKKMDADPNFNATPLQKLGVKLLFASAGFEL